MSQTVSIIIPCLNEEKAIAAALDSIRKQTSPAHEIIVVDANSDDSTCAIVKGYAEVSLVNKAERGRAQQMNQGAAIASGEWLLFLHADTLLPVNAIGLIQALSQDKHIKAGCFKQRFKPYRGFLRCISWLHNFRCRHSHIMYGDQSIFCRRSTFHGLQGYPLELMEDIKFSEHLLTQTQPVLLDAYVDTDARKFIQRGVWRSFFDVLVLILASQFKRPIPKISRSFFSDIR